MSLQAIRNRTGLEPGRKRLDFNLRVAVFKENA
jgi:hypothetical protein